MIVRTRTRLYEHATWITGTNVKSRKNMRRLSVVNASLDPSINTLSYPLERTRDLKPSI